MGKTPITPKGEIAALLASGNVGSRALILDDKDVVLLLKAAIEQEGSISACQAYRLERSQLNNMLNGKRPASGALIKALGLNAGARSHRGLRGR